MTIELNRIAVAGLAAVAMSAALIVGSPSQADTRTFVYGTAGSAKYEGIATNHQRKAINRSFKRNRKALRIKRSHSWRNFSGKTRIRISR